MSHDYNITVQSWSSNVKPYNQGTLWCHQKLKEHDKQYAGTTKICKD